MLVAAHIVQETTNGKTDDGSAADAEDVGAKVTKLVGELSRATD